MHTKKYIQVFSLLISLIATLSFSGCNFGDALAADERSSSNSVTYPSGLVIHQLAKENSLTQSYPSGENNPFGNSYSKFYNKPIYFIDTQGLAPEKRNSLVSSNFTLDEYIRIPERNGDLHPTIAPEITKLVQMIRTLWAKPLTFNSTFRSPRYNRLIGASTFSRHMYGDAIDIHASSVAMATALHELASTLEIDYLEPLNLTAKDDTRAWVHVDLRGWKVSSKGGE